MAKAMTPSLKASALPDSRLSTAVTITIVETDVEILFEQSTAARQLSMFRPCCLDRLAGETRVDYSKPRQALIAITAGTPHNKQHHGRLSRFLPCDSAMGSHGGVTLVKFRIVA